ncbi:MAG: DUF4180 domain-containing protein [bacterium]|nr:DUF4180 domain-containing protein [bacterium]
MNATVVKKFGKTYIAGIDGLKLIENESDAVDVVGLCGENDTQDLLLFTDNLTDSFFDIKSRVAGTIMQKFVNYSIRIAAVISPAHLESPRFREMALESNKGNHFRVFFNRDEAEGWLINA